MKCFPFSVSGGNFVIRCHVSLLAQLLPASFFDLEPSNPQGVVQYTGACLLSRQLYGP